MKNNQTWTSPTHGKLTLEEIPRYIRDYYNRMKQYDTNIRILYNVESIRDSYYISIIQQKKGSLKCQQVYRWELLL